MESIINLSFFANLLMLNYSWWFSMIGMLARVEWCVYVILNAINKLFSDTCMAYILCMGFGNLL